MNHTLRMTAVGLLLLLLLACSSGVTTLRQFRGAIEGGADCQELFDQRERFEGREDVLPELDASMAEVGCTSPDSERNDQ